MPEKDVQNFNGGIHEAKEGFDGGVHQCRKRETRVEGRIRNHRG
jgi:hypothetical protein